MEKYSRHRSKNFTNFDRNLLIDIVEQNLHIVENKKTDAANVKIKHEAWAKIAIEFNAAAQAGCRTAKQLHALYDCMKKKIRKMLVQDKNGIQAPNGESILSQLDGTDQRILSLVKQTYDPGTIKFDLLTACHEGESTEKDAGYEGNDESVDSLEEIVSDSLSTVENSENSIKIIPKIEQTEDLLQLQSQVVSALKTDQNESTVPASSSSDKVQTKVSVVPITELLKTTIPLDILQSVNPAPVDPVPCRKQDHLDTLLPSRYPIKRKFYREDRDEALQKYKIEILQLEKQIKEKELQQKVEAMEQSRRLFDIEIQNKEIEREILKAKLKLCKQDNA